MFCSEDNYWENRMDLGTSSPSWPANPSRSNEGIHFDGVITDCTPSTSGESTQRSSPATTEIHVGFSTSHQQIDASYIETLKNNGYSMCFHSHTPTGEAFNHLSYTTWPMLSSNNYAGDFSLNIDGNADMPSTSRTNWRDHLRQLSRPSFQERHPALRVRGIVKGPSMRLTTRSKLLNEAMLFSLTPPAYVHKSLPPVPIRAPRWISAARRAVRARKHAQAYTGRHIDTGKIRGLSVTRSLPPILEEHDCENASSVVNSVIDVLNSMDVQSKMGPIRNEQPDHSVSNALTHFTGTNFQLGHDNMKAPDAGERARIDDSDDLCERFSEMPVVVRDPENVRALRESFQSFHVTHLKQD